MEEKKNNGILTRMHGIQFCKILVIGTEDPCMHLSQMYRMVNYLQLLSVGAVIEQ